MDLIVTWLKRLSGNVWNYFMLFILEAVSGLALLEFRYCFLLDRSFFPLKEFISSIVPLRLLRRTPVTSHKADSLQLQPRPGAGCDNIYFLFLWLKESVVFYPYN